jgi:hypothetical protein
MVSIVIWRCGWGKVALGNAGNHEVPWNEDKEIFVLKIHTGTFDQLHENKHSKDNGVRCRQRRKQVYINF